MRQISIRQSSLQEYEIMMVKIAVNKYETSLYNHASKESEFLRERNSEIIKNDLLFLYNTLRIFRIE